MYEVSSRIDHHGNEGERVDSGGEDDAIDQVGVLCDGLDPRLYSCSCVSKDFLDSLDSLYDNDD
jgi:hypothetical protein